MRSEINGRFEREREYKQWKSERVKEQAETRTEDEAVFSVQGFRVQEGQRTKRCSVFGGSGLRKNRGGGQESGVGGQEGRVMGRLGDGKTYLDVEDLRVYQQISQLHTRGSISAEDGVRPLWRFVGAPAAWVA